MHTCMGWWLILRKNDRQRKWSSASPLLWHKHTHTLCLRTFFAYFIPYEAEALFACRELWELPGQADWLTDWSGSFWYWHKVDGRLLLCVCFQCVPALAPRWLDLLCATARSFSPDVKTFSSARSHYFLLNAFTLGLKLFVVVLLHRKAISRSGLQHLGPSHSPFPALSNGPAKELRSTVDWSVSVLHLSFTLIVYPTVCLISFAIKKWLW